MKITSASLRRLAPLFIMATSTVISLPAVAQNAAMPGGSWQQTCEGASIQNGMLYARCRQDNGQYRQTSALLRSTCQSYSNRNGQLYCDQGNASAQSRWRGSYDQSCRDIAVDKHGRLSASCPKANGKFNRTNITPGQCPSYRVANSNGKLVCETQSPDSGNGGKRWEGSFAQSCRDVVMNSVGTLTATCQARNGTWQRTSLAAVNCTNNRAVNDDGHLACESHRVGIRNRWDGSYKQTCRDIYMDADATLTATCQSSSGSWVPTRLAPRGCDSYRAGNNNGHLVCEGQGNANNRWDGSYAQSCRDVSVNSAGTLTATCQTRNGNWQRTSLAAVNCNNNRAANDDGRLVCESQRVGKNRWDGSFQNSCRDIYMDADGTLTATCQSSSGAWVPTRLAARGCDSYRAGNNNGQLVCEGQGNAINRWEGSFAQSCRDISTGSNGVLTATCQTRNGNWQRTSLEARQCNSLRAGNNDGRLFCEK